MPFWPRVFLKYLVLLSACRFGEANNPGPFAMGAINPTGLLGKQQQLQQLPFDSVWGVSETHLTTMGITQFRSELAINRSQFRFHASHPAPYVRHTMGIIGGKSTGVGILSSFPSRSMPDQWPSELKSEARCHAAAVCVNGVWVRLGVCYGYAKSPHNIVTKQKTDQQLALLTDRIVHNSTGPRVICGDFNQTLGQLPHEAELIRAGFVEIQQWAFAKWGQQVQVTCKNNSVKDFMWISPELIPYLESVTLDHELFADHSVLVGHFRDLQLPPPILVWPRPRPLPWDQLPASEVTCLEIEESSEPFQPPDVPDIFRQLEERAHRALLRQDKPGILPQQRGRAQQIRPKMCKFQRVPLKNSRKGELLPGFVGEHFQHAQWLRQARRFQSLQKLLGATNQSSNHSEHAHQLWKAIIAAPGFRHHWMHKANHLPGAPAVLPKMLPDTKTLAIIAVTFMADFRSLETLLKKTRWDYAKQARQDNPHRIYQDVARPRPTPVQTLLTSVVAHVTSVDPDNKEIQYEPCSLDVDQPVQGPAGLVHHVSHKPGVITCADQISFEEGTLITQDKLLGDHQSILPEFEALWMGYWGRHSNTPAARWQPFVEMCKEYVEPPANDMVHTPITVQQWKRAVRSKKKLAAVGPDGISRLDLLRMPDDLTAQLVDCVNKIEAGAPWPESTMQGTIHALEKRDDSARVGDFRPICIFSMIYRTWGSIRARQILKHLASVAPPELIGNRPRRETAHVWWQVALQVEQSLTSSEPLSGAVADLQKCFNCIPRIPVFVLSRLLKVPEGICLAWQSAMTQMVRRFSVGGSLGAPLMTTCGYPEGCAMSVVAMFMINIAYAAFMAPSTWFASMVLCR